MSSGSAESSRSRGRLHLRGELLLALGSILVFFGGLELILRLFDFHYTFTPQEMQLQLRDDYIDWQNRTIPLQKFEAHPVRMWTAKPGEGNVNEAGYQGTQVPELKTPDTVRILFLGDSCTSAGADRYPELVVSHLGSRGVPSEALIAAVGGYSTQQGLHFFRDSVRYAPDLVVAYFGWNDHWKALGGLTDREFRPPGRVLSFVRSTVGRLRIYQAIHYLVYPPVPREGAPDDPGSYSQSLRVPLRDYRDNLGKMVQLAAELNVPIFFVEAPLGPHLVDNDMRPLAEATFVPELHRAYVEALRSVAAGDPRAHCVSFDDLEFHLGLMMRDGIHPTPDGDAVIAARIANAIIDSGALGDDLEPIPMPAIPDPPSDAPSRAGPPSPDS